MYRNTSLISVIVPVYNVEKYLEKSIDSILNQTYKNLEIILIDDGSSDRSGEICDEFAKKDQRVKVVHKENSGLSCTRNLGIDLSNGQYIAFIDGDDYISENFFEILYNIIVKEKCDIACLDLETVREDGYKTITSDDIEIAKTDSQLYIFDKEQILKEVLLRKSFKNYVCTKLYRKKVFDICRFKEGLHYEDILFMYEISKTINKIAYMNRNCYFYLKRSNSITAVCSEKNLNDFLDVVIYRYNDIKERNCIEEKYNIFALLESIISISIKYVTAKQLYPSVLEKSKYIFEILKEYMLDVNNESELIPLLTDSEKVCLYLILYNQDLFYNFLSTRQEMRMNGNLTTTIVTKPKICLLCDAKGWAFDMIAQKIKKDLSHKYDIKIDYFDMYKEPDKLFEHLESNKNCDLIHVFWRKTLLLLESDAFKQKVEAIGKNCCEYIHEISKKISTCVYDFLYMEKENIEVYKNVFNQYSSNYYVSTKSLYEKYSAIKEYKKPWDVIHDICDWNVFQPQKLERFHFDSIENRELVVGWTGNSERKVEGKDLKGLHTIIKPVIQELKNGGYHIKEWYADRNERWRTMEEMPSYYSEIDLYLCTSIHEGTPRPVLEAMSCGVPIISTNVGIVPEVFGKKQVEFIIGDRENGENDEQIREALKEKIIYLYNNRYLLKELSEENMESIKKYDGGTIIKKFDNFFEQCLDNAKKIS